MVKVLVLGASGIVGQTMRLCHPPEVDVIYHRRTPTPYFEACDFTNDVEVIRFVQSHAPEVVINLAGENRPDVVEREPSKYHWINVHLPEVLGDWCRIRQVHFIQVSSQGIFSGRLPPYRANFYGSEQPVNMYGAQKLKAEWVLWRTVRHLSIVRLTFVLGVRPIPWLSRQNPMERWADPVLVIKEVMDRYFSPCPAIEAARHLWRLAMGRRPESPTVYHVGYPVKMSRDTLATLTRHLIGGLMPEPVSHACFEDIAERPRDTTFANDALRGTRLFIEHLTDMATAWKERMDATSSNDRCLELAMFFKSDLLTVRHQLRQGFAHFHQQVAVDYRAANVQSDDDLLAWYRRTVAYIWELTAYHLDPGFNYFGMLTGIRDYLKQALSPAVLDDGLIHVLCLADGVGDLSLFLNETPDFAGYYHDLAQSKTAEFAAFRYFRRYGTAHESRFVCNMDWNPLVPPVAMDAIIALDFFEHVPNVESWVQACFRMLRPGGLFMAQNAFAIGDDEHGGSIPMHLTRNNHYEWDWDPLLERTGFERVAIGTWWRKP